MGISSDLKLAISGFDQYLKEASSNEVTDERLPKKRIELLDAAEKVTTGKKIEFRTRYFTFVNAHGQKKQTIDDLNNYLQHTRQKVEDSLEIISDKLVRFHTGHLSFKAYESLLVPKSELIEKVEKWSKKENYAQLYDVKLVPNSYLNVITCAKEYSNAIDALRGKGDIPLKWLDVEKLDFEKKECKKSLKAESASLEEILKFTSDANISEYVVEKVKKWAQKSESNDSQMRD